MSKARGTPDPILAAVADIGETIHPFGDSDTNEKTTSTPKSGGKSPPSDILHAPVSLLECYKLRQEEVNALVKLAPVT